MPSPKRLALILGPQSNSGEDNFEFDVSTNGGASYQTAFTLAGGNDEVRVVELPAGTSGTVFVRVRDSNRSKGANALDSVSVRQIYIESSDSVILTAPMNLVATPLSDSEIELTWEDGTGETQYIVREGPSWTDVGAPLAADTTSTIVGGLLPDTMHTYQVCGDDGISSPECSFSAAATTYPEGGGGTAPNVTGCSPISGNPRDRIPVTVSGSNFVDGATANFGNGIAVQKISFNSSSVLVVTIKIDRNATAGFRQATITNPDGQSGFNSGCFEVK